MRNGARYFALAIVVAALTTVVTTTTGLASESRQAGSERRVLVRKGDIVSFQGLGWTCNLGFRPDPVGVLDGPKGPWRLSVGCLYKPDDGGCPGLLLANPYVFFFDSPARRPLETQQGTHWVRTHYGGCD